MKINKINSLIPLFILLVLHLSCSQKSDPVIIEPEKEEENEPDDPNAPSLTWRENWLEHELLLTRQYYNDSIALYYDEDMDIKVTWPRRALAKVWNYTWKTYGGFGKDPRLKVVLHGGTYGGGHPGYYLSSSHGYINVVDGGLSKERWKDSVGEPLDLMTHEIGHIVEGTSYNTLESPAFTIWGDSKWMEIYQYDVYKNLGWTDKAATWHERMLGISDNFPKANTFWYRDWFYPIYSKYGGSAVLNRFFKSLSENFPTTTIPNGRKYTRNLNFGEFVFFWSVAAKKDLSELALVAFGEKDRNGENWLPQFEKAKTTFTAIGW